MISSRSRLTFSGITARNRTPITAQAIAREIEVEPLDASHTIVSAVIAPVSTPCPRMNAATRSLVDPDGSRYSSLSQIVQPVGSSVIGMAKVRPAMRIRAALRWTRDMAPRYATANPRSTRRTGYDAPIALRGPSLPPATHAIRRLLDQRDVRVVYQPVVDLGTRTIFAYEALARPKGPEFAGPSSCSTRPSSTR